MTRKICESCKEEINLTQEQVDSLKVPEELLRNIRAFKGKGCKECNNTGKSGRIGIYEVMPITERIESLILSQSPDNEIRKVALEEGMFSLRMAAIDKMKKGVISIDEVFATTTG
jgi:type IV pilus assembly protein PilB